MEVKLKNISKVGTWSLKGTHLSNHWQSHREWLRGHIEGDVQNLAGIDNSMDCFECINGVGIISFDGVGGILGILEVMTSHIGECVQGSLRGGNKMSVRSKIRDYKIIYPNGGVV